MSTPDTSETNCGPNSENCSCHTFEETGVLRVQRIIQQNTEGIHHTKRKIRKIQRYQQDTDDDMEDDDDEEDIDEDIVLEETLEDEDVSTTTTSDSPEKEEMLEEIQKEIEKEMKVISKNNTLDKTLNSKKKSGSLRICHNEILSLLMINVFLANIFWS